MYAKKIYQADLMNQGLFRVITITKIVILGIVIYSKYEEVTALISYPLAFSHITQSKKNLIIIRFFSLNNK